MTEEKGSMGSLPNIEKLNGMANYSNWKFSMEMYLMHEDLWDCIERTDDGELSDKDKRKDVKARTKICLMVKPTAYTHVRNAKTAKEAWDNLQKAYQDRGLNSRIDLLQVLMNTKLENCKNMEAYITKIMDVAQGLAECNSPLDDDFMAAFMLAGLPDEYKPMRMAMENSGIKLTTEYVKSRLLQEDMKRDMSLSKSNAFLSKDKKFHSKPREKLLAPGLKCYRCNKLGHIAKQCTTKVNFLGNSGGNVEHSLNQQNFKNSNNGYEHGVMTSKSKCNGNKGWTLLTALAVNVSSTDWYIDSGASTHMTNCKEWLVDFNPNVRKEITVANNQKILSEGVGNVLVKLSNNEEKVISNAMYVPNLTTNLLSVDRMVQNGLAVVFTSSGCSIYLEDNCLIKGEVLASASNVGGLFKLDCIHEGGTITRTEQVNTAIARTDAQLWHERLGHLNWLSMNVLRKHLATGLTFSGSEKLDPCVACVEGKLSRLPFPDKASHRASHKLELVHTDLCGPINELSISGCKYILTFIDDFTRKTFGYFLKSKDQVFETFKTFKAMVENETDMRIKCLRSDNGTEYINHNFEDYLSENGIKHQKTVKYTPEQNGVAERANRTIIEKVRCMLQNSGLSSCYWAEAANTAIYLKNRCPSRAVRGFTPQELWTGEKVNLSHLKIFGCVAYAHVPKQCRKKLDPKAKKYIFVGYCEETKGYRLIDPDNPMRLEIARDVVFMEHMFLKSAAENNTNETEKVPLIEILSNSLNENATEERDTSVEVDESTDFTESQNNGVYEQLSDSVHTSDLSNGSDTSTINQSEHQESTRYPVRSRKPKEFPDFVTFQTVCPGEPTSVEDALQGKDKGKWQEAMKCEYDSLLKNKSWELVNLPTGKKPINSKWIFKIKTDAEGNVERYKARLVAKGCSQTAGIDYDETFSPVVRHSSMRVLFALAAEFNLSIDHLDVTTAFLNGDLDEVVYMKQPEGFIQRGQEDKVCLLKKAIYGLKQSSRAWYMKIDKVLISLSFKRCDSEPCIYFRKVNGSVLIIALYVDDFLVFSNNLTEKEAFKKKLMNIFQMKDLGEAKHVIGYKITRSDGAVLINQKKYIESVLEMFHMKDCHPIATPLDPGQKFTQVKDDHIPDSRIPYQRLIGCLMYLSVCSRPDISHAVSVLSRFNTCYTNEHWEAAKRILRYLKGTMDLCIRYEKTGVPVFGLVDADWAGDSVDRKSYSGLAFIIAGGVVSWESKKQPTVALSSTEAEYMALTQGAKEAMYLRNLLQELMGSYLEIKIFNDNQSAQKLSVNQVFHSRTKHIDVRHHFIREAINSKKISVHYVTTNEMWADVLTKVLNKQKHYVCLDGLGLIKSQQ